MFDFGAICKHKQVPAYSATDGPNSNNAQYTIYT